MKLFLASGSDALAQISRYFSAKKATVLFIANAADNDPEPHWWVESDREQFKKIGYEINEIDLRNISKEDFVQQLENSDIVHFCGGSTLYLINLLRKRSLDVPLVESVKSDKVLYSGASAGSMIAAGDLSLCRKDDEEKEAIAQGATDFKGLGLVNFLVLPHCNNEHFAKSNSRMVAGLVEVGQPIIAIRDSQAIWVENEKFQIVEV
jgi:peptidase E